MKNKIRDLDNHLFSALERLNDDEIMASDGDKEVNRAKAISEISKNVIKSADLQLKAQRLHDDGIIHDKPAVLTKTPKLQSIGPK